NSCLTAGDRAGHGEGGGEGDGDGDGDGAGDGAGDMPCEGRADCLDPDAPAGEPDSGECVSCTATLEADLACAEADANTPVCQDGSCVQCAEGKEGACGGVTPICDDAASMCVGCSDHDQCPASACNLLAGNCMDPAAVVHVDGDGGQDYTTLTAALDDFAGGRELPIIFQRYNNDSAYQGSVGIAGTVALLAAPGEEPRLQGNMSPAA